MWSQGLPEGLMGKSWLGQNLSTSPHWHHQARVQGNSLHLKREGWVSLQMGAMSPSCPGKGEKSSVPDLGLKQGVLKGCAKPSPQTVLSHAALPQAESPETPQIKKRPTSLSSTLPPLRDSSKLKPGSLKEVVKGAKPPGPEGECLLSSIQHP